MKKNKLYILFFLVNFLFSKGDIEPTYMTTFGTVTLDDKIYNQVSFRPEFSIKKLGIGLDFYIYFDEKGNFYSRNWDFSSGSSSIKTILDKIYYIRYGIPSDDLYFRIGSLPNITMGHGILVNRYANNMDYPQVRRLGFNLKYLFPGDIKIEFVHNNLKEFGDAGLVGFRGEFPIINKLDLGFTLVGDLNQIEGLADSDDDGFPDAVDAFDDNENLWHEDQIVIQKIETAHKCDYEGGNGDCNAQIDHTLEPIYNNIESQRDEILEYLDDNPVSGLSIDLTYQVSDKMYVFTEFAQLSNDTDNPYNKDINFDKYEKFDTNLGYGFVPIGLKAQFKKISFSLDYRQSSEKFIFNYWNQNYDHNRIMLDSEKKPYTKESTLYKYGKQKGINFGFIASLSKFFKFSINYLSMKGDKWNGEDGYIKEKNNSLYTKFEIDTSSIPRIRIAEVFYQQTNTEKIFDFEPNEYSLIGYNFGVELSNNMALIFKGRKSYQLDDKGKYNPVINTQIETSVYF